MIKIENLYILYDLYFSRRLHTFTMSYPITKEDIIIYKIWKTTPIDLENIRKYKIEKLEEQNKKTQYYLQPHPVPQVPQAIYYQQFYQTPQATSFGKSPQIQQYSQTYGAINGNNTFCKFLI